MKKKSILLSIAFATILNAEGIKSVEYINLTKISPTVAKETFNLNEDEEISLAKINQAVKDFYKYGYFEDISVSNDNGVLKFFFKEKPSVANVDIFGYKSRETDLEILKKQIGLSKGTMYSTEKIKKAKEELLRELEKEGYINSVVEVEIENLNENAVSITFNVNKGDEIVIKKVNYFGAKSLSTGKFEKVTANKEEEFASWFFTQNDGELKADQLQYDGKRIQELYLENGYIDAKVEDPFLEVDFASNQADLDFYIDEGIQYTVNKIKIYIKSDIVKAKFLYSDLKLKEDRVFNIKKLRRDSDFIRTKIADLGYAFAKINYDVKKDEKNGTVDIVFNVVPGEKVYVRDVKITGNSRTLDRVIRRNVYLAPGDLFSQTDFTDTQNKLKRVGYFEDVRIEQKRVSKDQMDLVVKVKEAPTGNIILGGGYGSYDGIMINASLNERNIFGSGLGLSISAELSDKESDLAVKLINPAIRDSEYNGDIDIHNKTDEINNDAYDLDKDVKGFSIGLGKEVIRNLKVGARYRLDFIKENYEYSYLYNHIPVSQRYKDTDYVTSSITPYLSFDNTNDYYFPTSGFRANTSLEIAGLGGDSEYIKSSSSFKYFYSLEDRFNWDVVLRYKAQVNLLVDNGQINQGDSLYLGGTKSLRGFKSYAFGPDNDNGIAEEPYKRMAATSVEFSMPLIPDANMRWGLFYDYGMIGEDSFTDIKRSSTGALFEWVSPFGPLQLIFAQPIDDEPGDDTSSFEFALGSTF
ncbi:outer membrane protein assembly factor BamA [Campylobacterota bacterium DY0563]|uniref:outer membrane protein assembly factor BamA n=1 Tax=Halarcobacter sp. TaxID=2321133 RepID=UPI0029F5184E|nr:outer membrane protein assembly factor BamA [Halarcobacter sp.]